MWSRAFETVSSPIVQRRSLVARALKYCLRDASEAARVSKVWSYEGSFGQTNADPMLILLTSHQRMAKRCDRSLERGWGGEIICVALSADAAPGAD